MTGKDVSLEKDLLENAATIKRFGYSPLGKELKEQTDTERKQYQGLDKIYDFNETININDEKPKLEKSIGSKIWYITLIIVFPNIIVVIKSLMIS